MLYTTNDYLLASEQRIIDIDNFKVLNKSLISSAYLSGVAVECILRANILKHTNEFDDKHDLNNLLLKSKILDNISPSKRKKLTTSIQILNRKWVNNMRYNSVERMKRAIAHELAGTNRKKVGLKFNNYFKDIIDTSKIIITMGKENGFA